MKAIYISDELHRRAKQRAAELGLSLKEVIEQWVAQGMRELPAEMPVSLRESPVRYEVAAPPATMLSMIQARSADTDQETLLADLERRGVLIKGERLREQLRAEYLAQRKACGLTTPPPAAPPNLEVIQESFRQQRTLHPDVPSVTELVIQMREEE